MIKVAIVAFALKLIFFACAEINEERKRKKKEKRKERKKERKTIERNIKREHVIGQALNQR